VIVDGLYGAATANKRILFVQVLPGPLALIGGHRAAMTAILTVSRTRAEQLTGPGLVLAVLLVGASCRSVRCGRVRPVAGPFVAPRRLRRSRVAEVEVANAVDVKVWVARR
jgi:hypothetical protein